MKDYYHEVQTNSVQVSAKDYYKLGKAPFDVPGEVFESLLGRKIEPWHPLHPFTMNSTLGEIKDCAPGHDLYEQIGNSMTAVMGNSSDDIAAMLAAMIDDMPICRICGH